MRWSAGYTGCARCSDGSLFVCCGCVKGSSTKKAHQSWPRLESPFAKSPSETYCAFHLPVLSKQRKQHILADSKVNGSMVTNGQGSRRVHRHPVSHKGQTQWNQSSRQTLLRILTAAASAYESRGKGGRQPVILFSAGCTNTSGIPEPANPRIEIVS